MDTTTATALAHLLSTARASQDKAFMAKDRDAELQAHGQVEGIIAAVATVLRTEPASAEAVLNALLP